MNNVIVKYKVNIDRIENMLKSIKSMGTNVSDFENSFLDITNDVDSRISELGIIGFNQKDNINNIYQYGVDKTSKLLIELEKYNDYYQALNKCYYIQGTQNKIDYSESEIDAVVNDVINLLKVINNFDGVSENNNLIDKLYDFIYSLMKIEFVHNGTSRLFDYCKNNETDAYFINKCMFMDIDSITESGKNTNVIKSLLSRKIKINRTCSIIDEELIQLISLFDKRDKYSKELHYKLSSLSKELVSLDARLSDSFSSKSNTLRDKIDAQENCKSAKSKNRKLLVKNFLPFLMCTVIIAGLHVGIMRIIKGNEYNTDIETYSAQTGETVKTNEYIPKIEKINGEVVTEAVMIDVAGPWREVTLAEDQSKIAYYRDVERTAISGIEYEDIKEYLNLNPDYIDGNHSKSTYSEVSYGLSESDNYATETKNIIIQRQDLEDSQMSDEMDLSTLGMISCLMFAIEFLLLVIVELLSSKDFFEDGYIGRIINLKRALVMMVGTKFDAKSWAKKLSAIDNEISTIIQENDVIKNEYLKFINSPKYKILFEEYKESMSKINGDICNIEKQSYLLLSKKV